MGQRVLAWLHEKFLSERNIRQRGACMKSVLGELKASCVHEHSPQAPNRPIWAKSRICFYCSHATLQHFVYNMFCMYNMYVKMCV